MTKTIHSFKDREEFTDNPYKELYIYYLHGRLKLVDKICGSDFIGNWQEDDFSFLFFSKPSPDKVSKILSSNPGLALLDEFHMTYDQWQGGKTVPEKIGRFVIVPPWKNNGKKRNFFHEELTILLDPGVVFGNGLHTTTRDCLEALEIVFLRDCIEFAIDLGTGTGILALAASLLGCRSILAVDFNFLAANTALRNVRLNSLESRNRINIIKTWECDGIWHTFLGKKD
jgi:ribosomal protein L11 methyltransferase